MSRDVIIRRALHMTAPLYLFYYLIPDEPIVGAYKWYGIIAVLGGVAVFETLRIISGKNLPGLRDYERGRVSALAWGAFGIGLGLLFFPYYLTIPAVFCMGFIDPLCGELRLRYRTENSIRRRCLVCLGIPLAITFLIWFLALLSLTPWALVKSTLFSAVGAPIVIMVEGRNLGYLDDDFLMVIAPLLCLFVLEKSAIWLGFLL